MLQEKEEEHLCVLMSRWRKKGKDMRDWSCWQAMNVLLLLHIALCCSLHPQALYSVDVKLLSLLEMKQHVVKWLSHHLEPHMLLHVMHFLEPSGPLSDGDRS